MTGSMFCTDHGVAQRQIPSSCIESAEYVIQCINNNALHNWQPGNQHSPEVFAQFGNATFNISSQEDFHNDPQCVNLTDYVFASLPNLGQGIILLNKTTREGRPYNMHLGAVVATARYRIYITDVSEQREVEVTMQTWRAKCVTNVGEFRGHDYPGDQFAIGLLRV